MKVDQLLEEHENDLLGKIFTNLVEKHKKAYIAVQNEYTGSAVLHRVDNARLEYADSKYENSLVISFIGNSTPMGSNSNSLVVIPFSRIDKWTIAQEHGCYILHVAKRIIPKEEIEKLR